MTRPALIVLTILFSSAPFLPAAAQGTSEQRLACEGDAFKFCGKDIPDATKIEACLRAKLTEISPACRAQFEEAKK